MRNIAMLAVPCLVAVLIGLGFSDNLRAQDAAQADKYAKLPHWPIGLKLPEAVVKSWEDPRAERSIKSPDADVLVWVPPDAKRLRAVLMLANNTDLVKIGEHKAIREVAAKHGIGILYLQHFSGKVIEHANPPKAELATATFDAMLDLAAERTGLAEFRHAPWITIGKSSRGKFAFQPAWMFPGRVVASVAYHGETPTWPLAGWARTDASDSVIHLNVQGLTEWDGTWYRHVRPMLLNYNSRSNWLAHQVVIYGVDHGYYMDYYIYPNFQQRLDKNHKFTRVTSVWDYVALHIDKAMTLRVPEDVYATEKPITLKQVDRDSGYLIHPRAIEELHSTKWFALRKGDDGQYQTIPWPEEVTPVHDTKQGSVPWDQLIRPAGEVPEADRGHYMWVADLEQARAWLNLHNTYNTADRVLPKE